MQNNNGRMEPGWEANGPEEADLPLGKDGLRLAGSGTVAVLVSVLWEGLGVRPL